MANIRCPMCSKINPPEAEKCSFCGARLKPVIPGEEQDEGLSPAKPSSDEPDWLMDLRSENRVPQDTSQGGPTGQPEQDSGSAEEPDWLSRIRDRARQETNPVGAEEESSEEADWMKGFQQAGETTEEPAISGENFLDRLSGTTPSGPSTDELRQIDDWVRDVPEETPPSASAENEDWISKLSAWQTGAADAGQEETPELGLPAGADQGPVGQSEPPQENTWSSSGETGGLSAWFRNEQEDPAAPHEEDQFPSWLGEKKEENLPAEADEDLISGWLQDTPAAQAPSQADDLPDWLANAQETPSSHQGSVSGESQGAGEESLPDWFSSFTPPESTGETGNEPETPSEAAAGEFELPDWLGSAGASKEESAAPLPAQEAPSGEADWFAQLGDFSQQETSGQESEEQPAEDLEAPNEMAAPNKLAAPESPAAQTAAPESATQVPSFDENETPDWLRNFSDQEPAGGAATPALIGSDQPVPGLDASDQAFLSNELPDWLSEETVPAEAAREPSQAAETAGEEILKAELPEWVKDMRPIESVIPGEPEPAEAAQQAEKAGPLAGLRGVLPAEELITRYRKPPVYSAKLRISEKQRNQASLLDSIITQESQPLLIPPVRSNAPRLVARIIIALLLLAVLAGLRWFPLGIKPMPMLTPAELRDMFDQIDKIPQQAAPVLLAVDYEPGRAGEMYYASAPVVEHLMAKNARIVVLSTVPTGPALAQQLLADTAADFQKRSKQTYALDTQTINLGYLPGGTISLLEFAKIPSQAAPANLAGDFSVWQNTFLKNVTDMGGFSQVIVLTDSAETGRAWVEQVQPLMGSTPLFMVTSAQVAPLLMPYIQSQQINGMVSGLLGGVIYGQWRQVETPAGVYWESYQVGILLAVVIILIGGLISGGVAISKRKEKDEA